jgi:hypothetical protein
MLLLGSDIFGVPSAENHPRELRPAHWRRNPCREYATFAVATDYDVESRRLNPRSPEYLRAPYGFFLPNFS